MGAKREGGVQEREGELVTKWMESIAFEWPIGKEWE
jgi:hypothetical protein